jgi:FkbM family methyltransferase
MGTNGELDFLKKHAAGLRVAFDVGANKGDWTRASLAIRPGLAVTAFEPDPAMCAAFLANGFPKNVICENEGLGAKREKRTFYVNPGNPGMNSFVKRSRFGENELVQKAVALDTVDAYCAEHGIQKIDFMKVDVEGFEMDVLRGAQGMIRKKAVSIIQFEYGGTYLDSHASLKDAFMFFKEAGYVFYKLLPRGAVRINEYSPALEDYAYSNYAAIAQ